MMIDWFTVGAQALNFIVLVWLMRRFLYGPILRAVEARDERVASVLADATAKQLEARQARDQFEQRDEQLERDRERLLREAKEVAATEGQRLLVAAREAAQIARRRHEESLREAAESLQDTLEERAQAEVFAIARQTLSDLAGASLEERMTEEFKRRLRELDGPARAELEAALTSASGPALVRTAFDLPEAQKAAIEDALKESFSSDAAVEFETTPDVICGIELTCCGLKVAWSIAEYLRALTEGVRELVGEHPHPESEVDAEASVDPTTVGLPDPKEAAAPHGA